MVDSLHISRLK